MTPKVGQINWSRPNPAKPKHGKEFASKLVSRFEELPDETKRATESAFSKFPKEYLKKLDDTGHRVVFRKGKPGWVSGSYDDKNKIIFVSADPKGDSLCKQTVIHETVHALCRVGWDEQNGFLKGLLTPGREKDLARHDPELLKLHREYRERSLAGFGQALSDRIDLQGESGDKGITHLGGREFRWKRGDGQISFKDTGGRFGRVMEHAGADLKKGTLFTLGGAATAGLVLAATGPIAAAAMGILSIPLFISGGQLLKSGVRSAAREMHRPQVDNELVKTNGREVTVKLGKEIPEEQKLVSDYAATQRQPEEYLAESMTEYLISDQSRDKLKRRDPGMYEYCKNWTL